MSRTQDRRLGFIEGNLYCHRHDANNRGGTFSKTAREYVRPISQWYRINDVADEIDEKRAQVAIADVLFKFRDRGKPAAQPAPPKVIVHEKTSQITKRSVSSRIP